MKVKSSQNNATQVESKTSEELALILNQQYAQLMQAQQNIQSINQILKERQKPKP